jgi:hypothetical protein
MVQVFGSCLENLWKSDEVVEPVLFASSNNSSCKIKAVTLPHFSSPYTLRWPVLWFFPTAWLEENFEVTESENTHNLEEVEKRNGQPGQHHHLPLPCRPRISHGLEL